MRITEAIPPALSRKPATPPCRCLLLEICTSNSKNRGRSPILQLIDALENGNYVPFFNRAEANAEFNQRCNEYGAGRYAVNKPKGTGEWHDLINNTTAIIIANQDFLKSIPCSIAERDGIISEIKPTLRMVKAIEDWIYYQLQDPATRERLLASVAD